MQDFGRTTNVILAVIAVFLGMIALPPLFDPHDRVMAEPARFDHIFIVSTMFLYKGQQGLLVMDRRNANVWFIPKANEQFQPPIFIFRVPFEKLDQVPQ